MKWLYSTLLWATSKQGRQTLPTDSPLTSTPLTGSNYIALGIIAFYQRFLSPYKGYHCAHASLHQGESCSHAVQAIIRDHGVWQGRQLIRQRFAACQDAHGQLKEDARRRKEKAKDKAADCCGNGCDLASCLPLDMGGAACPHGGNALSHACHGIDLPCACGW